MMTKMVTEWLLIGNWKLEKNKSCTPLKSAHGHLGKIQVALFEEIEDNQIMEQLKQLIEQMEAEMRQDLKRSGDLEEYGEEGIRTAVYEDLKDSLKHLFSDILYK